MPDSPATPHARALLCASNALAAVALTWVASLGYAAAPWNRAQMREWHTLGGWIFTGLDFLLGAATAYSVALTVWMLAERTPRVGKSLRCVAFVWRWPMRLMRRVFAARTAPGAPPSPDRALAPSADERLALLTTLLKAFFGPLMVMSLMLFCLAAWKNGVAVAAAFEAGFGARALFDRWGFWFLFQAILFIDVALFTVGYLVETRRLGNEIRSVDATLLGWGVALACYPPFNTLTSKVLGSPLNEFPQFADPTVHLVLNGLLLVLMAVYACASVAMGWKASNLTHRGIVARWPYSLVRHPAYTCKNLAWWIGTAPLVAAAFERGRFAGLLALASMAGWSALYVLRALTEEEHLRRVSGDYAAYAAKVRWRFVPAVV